MNVLAQQRQEQGTRQCMAGVEYQAAALGVVRQLPQPFQQTAQ